MYLLNMEFVTNICGELRDLHKKTDKNIDKRREQVIIEIKKFALTANDRSMGGKYGRTVYRNGYRNV